jgi:homoserine O-succinyltransferase
MTDFRSLRSPRDRDPALPLRGWEHPAEFREKDPNCIAIGLVNNMPSAALESAERQFRTLLEAAAGGLTVRLTLYALPNVPRTEKGQLYVDRRCSTIHDLRGSHLDGLIVTGTEPRAQHLEDEPYWGALTELLEWANLHTHSSIWSCLAAHAAVLSIDGITRFPRADKCCGVFECATVADHPLTAGFPDRYYMPHSRWNEISDGVLTACGYRTLTRSENAGVDVFIKQRKSLFVFLQGHPEYEADTLWFEYRRDIRRFLRFESDRYPSMPHGYFDAETVNLVNAMRQRALSDRREESLMDFPATLAASRARNTWSAAAVCFYRNWLRYLRAQKERRLETQTGRSDGRLPQTVLQATREKRKHWHGTL